MSTCKTVKLAQLKVLVDTGALRHASLVGVSGGWSVHLQVQGVPHVLVSVDGKPRVYSTADSAIAQLRKLGMEQMDVIADRYEPGSRRAGRPDRAVALAETAEYGRWLHEKVQQTASGIARGDIDTFGPTEVAAHLEGLRDKVHRRKKADS